VMGDSKILMDWDNDNYQVSNLALGPIMIKVQEVKEKYGKVYFNCIFMEFNTRENLISKEALSLHEWILREQEFRGGVLILETIKSLF
jgi:hypothetical protein